MHPSRSKIVLLLSANTWTTIKGNWEVMREIYTGMHFIAWLNCFFFPGWQNRDFFICHHLKNVDVENSRLDDNAGKNPSWEVFPLIQCNILLNISEGQFHALFPRLPGHPQKNSSLQRLCRMMMHVLKWCKRGPLPQALLPIAHAEIQSYILDRNPNERCIISSIWSLPRPCG